MAFGFRVEVRIEGPVVGLREVAVPGREDLNDLFVLHGFEGRVDEALPVPAMVGVLPARRILLEEEVLVLGLRDRVDLEVYARVAAVLPAGVVLDDAHVRAEGIVDEAPARFAVLKPVRVAHGVRERAPALVEELRVLEGAVVGVVGAARVPDVDVRAPRDAVEFAPVAIRAHGPRHVRAVVVVHEGLPVAVDGKGRTRRGVVSLVARALRVAVALRPVGLAFDLHRMEALTLQFRVLLKERPGVHDADGNALPREAQGVGGRGVHRGEAPVLLVLDRLPGLLLADADLPGFFIGERGARRQDAGERRGDGHGDGALRPAERGLRFIGDDDGAAGGIPLGSERTVHVGTSGSKG